MQTAIPASESRKILTEEEKDFQILMSRKNDKKISEKTFIAWMKKRFKI
ncbi:MAG: hypothetical protein PHO48_00900 [Candidatus Gracilibacteria bacterium]|nr:hypothetical protein [Candidatus Gracilibacteria bacterium]MDD5179494.1 hypothetical protein [Candidatus Gracilibacteria bacterium]